MTSDCPMANARLVTSQVPESPFNRIPSPAPPAHRHHLSPTQPETDHSSTPAKPQEYSPLLTICHPRFPNRLLIPPSVTFPIPPVTSTILSIAPSSSLSPSTTPYPQRLRPKPTGPSPHAGRLVRPLRVAVLAFVTGCGVSRESRCEAKRLRRWGVRSAALDSSIEM